MSKVKKFCTNCGTPNANGKNFCTKCGTSLVIPEAEPVRQEAPRPVEQVQNPQPQQKSETPPKKSKKGLIISSSVIAALLLLAGGGFAVNYFYPNLLHPVSAQDMMQGTWYGMTTDGVSQVKDVEKMTIKGKTGTYTQISPQGVKETMSLQVDDKKAIITATNSDATSTATDGTTAPAKTSWKYTVKKDVIQIQSGDSKNLTVHKEGTKAAQSDESKYKAAEKTAVDIQSIAANLTPDQAQKVNDELANWFVTSSYGKGKVVAEKGLSWYHGAGDPTVIADPTVDGKLFQGIYYVGGGTFEDINKLPQVAGVSSKAKLLDAVNQYKFSLIGTSLKKDLSGSVYSGNCGFSIYQLDSGKTGLIEDEQKYIYSVIPQEDQYEAAATGYYLQNDVKKPSSSDVDVFPATNAVVYFRSRVNPSQTMKRAPQDVQEEYQKLLAQYGRSKIVQKTVTPQSSSSSSSKPAPAPKASGMNAEAILGGDYSSLAGTWQDAAGDTIVIDAEGNAQTPNNGTVDIEQPTTSTNGTVHAIWNFGSGPVASPPTWTFAPAGTSLDSGSGSTQNVDGSDQTKDRIFFTDFQAPDPSGNETKKDAYYKTSDSSSVTKTSTTATSSDLDQTTASKLITDAYKDLGAYAKDKSTDANTDLFDGGASNDLWSDSTQSIDDLNDPSSLVYNTVNVTAVDKQSDDSYNVSYNVSDSADGGDTSFSWAVNVKQDNSKSNAYNNYFIEGTVGNKN